MKIFAFGHKSRHGKDTAAKFLQTMCRQARLNAFKISFASKLKQCCHIMFEWAGVKNEQFYEEHPEERKTIIPALGMTVVELWIKFGTPMIREQLHDATWVNAALLAPPADCNVIVVSDLRFPNEVKRIKELGGYCIRVDRPGQVNTASVADSALDDFTDWDMILSATTLQELYREVEKVFNKWLKV